MGSHAGSIVGSSVSSGSRLLSKRLLFTTTCHQHWCVFVSHNQVQRDVNVLFGGGINLLVV